MPRNSFISKAVASAFVILTISAIAGMITMVIMYKREIEPLNPTERPTMATTTPSPPPVMRLPKNLIPYSYKISLRLRLYTRIIEEVNVTSPNQTLQFSGSSIVNFDCVQSTTTIFLHSKDLFIYPNAQVMNIKTEKTIHVLKMINHKDSSDFLEIQLGETLVQEESYSLLLNFMGKISENLDGLYLSTYHEGKPDKERFLAATSMEPTYARRVFPCFDEPEMKAVFDVTIIHRRDTTVLGNEKISVSNIIDDDWQYTTFYPTPKMSTYLFAFTVSEFTPTASTHGRVAINTYARPEATAAGHAAYAANITSKILTFYENYFESNYQQKKLDQIALPDLNSAAMENWGLITYEEGVLLYEEGVSSQLHKHLIATVVAHELAHQWFGNLVTMKWWNQIWLNEGFASYMTYLAVDHAEPTFKLKDILIMRDLHTALEADALTSSHPLSPQEDVVETTDEILAMFNAITYCKGAMVLRMLSDIIGESVFHKGIKLYLSDFKYNNTDQRDLWNCMQKAATEDGSHIKIAEVMKTWTNRTGYPVITINTKNGEIYQNRFLFDDSSESSFFWEIPIRVKSNTTEPSFIWLRTRGPEKKNELISKSGEWILANVNCNGYYRVNYDPENWGRLLTQLETHQDRIPLMNRGQLIDDAFNLARAKLVDVTLALNSTRYLQNETEYIPWESAVRNLEYFVHMFDRTEVYGPMQAYLRQQVKGLYNFFSNYTYKSGDQSLQYNQINIIDVACSNGLPECITMASNMFANWMNSNTSTNHIEPNLRTVIYCQAVAAGGDEEWEFAWNKFQSSRDTSEKDQLRQALSCTTKIWLLNRYLEYTLDPEKIRLMDVSSTINDIANNVAGHALAWNFIRANWDYVSQGDAAMLIEGVTSRFSKKFELEELERFSKDYNLGSAAWAVNQAIEQTQVNIQWVSDHKDVILKWFQRETAS
uniref:alanyl (membrane) aminopeptidase a n=1 Tax=Scatophagus argus TaxID=75038 RepID=UPI001ED839F7|nr:alanyl (membrane) aminopeptidase a [Scatophagus argus]